MNKREERDECEEKLLHKLITTVSTAFILVCLQTQTDFLLHVCMTDPEINLVTVTGYNPVSD